MENETASVIMGSRNGHLQSELHFIECEKKDIDTITAVAKCRTENKLNKL